MPEQRSLIRRAVVATVLGIALIGFPAPAIAAPACPDYFIGLHGLGEGRESKTINETWETLSSAAKLRGHVVVKDSLDFPKLDPTQFLTQTFLGNAESAPIVTTAQTLLNEINQVRLTCATTRFVVAGYSEGAWAVDYFRLHEAGMGLMSTGVVVGVELYGDPQWDNSIYAQGLARRFGAGLSPYIPIFQNSQVQSLCLPQDPICGEGFIPLIVPPVVQLGTAAICAGGATCRHYQYTFGATRQGGEFLASRL